LLVRQGNPKGITDRGDPVKNGVKVITPNPKTTGGARANYLAAWARAEKTLNDPKDVLKTLYSHVTVLDKGARDSTPTFTQRGIGDVLRLGKTKPIWRRRNWTPISVTSSSHRFRSWPNRLWRWWTATSTPTRRRVWPRPI
jgi:hypothetical protein